jgi:hypothetical protein
MMNESPASPNDDAFMELARLSGLDTSADEQPFYDQAAELVTMCIARSVIDAFTLSDRFIGSALLGALAAKMDTMHPHVANTIAAAAAQLLMRGFSQDDLNLIAAGARIDFREDGVAN